MAAADDPILPVAAQADWEAWLEAEHETADGVWLRLAKKTSGLPAPTWDECVDVALCFGWIDGQSKGIDATHYQQRYTPRRARSRWSKINRERVERLIAEGRMRPKGLEEVERAKEPTGAGTRPTTRRARRPSPTTCGRRSTPTRGRRRSSRP